MPLIFISHDSRDAELAELFETLLVDASGGMLKTFRSSARKGTTGMEFGAEWYATIMARLGEASDVVALLTPRSLERPWILYEVGVARGKLDHSVFGVAFGVPLEALTGPFAQFHNCGDDEDSLIKLVTQLIQRNPLAEPSESGVRHQVAPFKKRIARLSTVNPQSDPQIDSVAGLFEEVKAMFDVLPARLLATLDQRIPSLVDPAGPHWSEWLSRAREIAAAMWSAQLSDRAAHWRNIIDHLQEYVPRVSGSGAQIAHSLEQDSEHSYRKAIEAFGDACGPYLDSPAKVDQEAANVLRVVMTALRHWADTQPWGWRSIDSPSR